MNQSLGTKRREKEYLSRVHSSLFASFVFLSRYSCPKASMTRKGSLEMTLEP